MCHVTVAHCNNTATHCTILQHTATRWRTCHMCHVTVAHCNNTAPYCNTLQHTATRWRTCHMCRLPFYRNQYARAGERIYNQTPTALTNLLLGSDTCVCVRLRVCVCVRERERERECVCMCVWLGQGSTV